MRKKKSSANSFAVFFFGWYVTKTTTDSPGKLPGKFLPAGLKKIYMEI